MSIPISATIVGGHEVGETVRIGRGKVEWVIESFFQFTEDGEPYAALKPVEGYTNKTAPVSQLVAP